jgi:putative PIN family toxin of toxin-antitoxin system
VLTIVADTNVYISALNFGGAPDQVLALARSDAVLVAISQPILEDIEGVLGKKFGWSGDRTREALDVITAFTELVVPHESVDEIAEDPPDNRILECALAARADCIVSGDRHLQALGRFLDIPILSPREFLDSLS